MPQGGDVQQKDAVKFYGESQIKGKMEEEEEEGEKEESAEEINSDMEDAVRYSPSPFA